MLGWSGVCYQFFQIQDSEVQRQLMEIDGYPEFEIDKDNQLLIYLFPRENCIRLDELLNSIRSEYVKIYGGQALKLIQAILLHHKKIREQQKFHGNLTSRNVWIVFNQQSERFRCIFSKLDYKIHFTGYQTEPLNNNYDKDNECSSVVVDILNVLEYCQSDGHKQKYSKSNINLEKLKQMLFLYAQEEQHLLELIETLNSEYHYQENLVEICRFRLGGARFQQAVDNPIKIIFNEECQNLQSNLEERIKWKTITIRQEMKFWEFLPKIVQQIQNFSYNLVLKQELKQIEQSIWDLILAINCLKSSHYEQMLNDFQNKLNEEFEQVLKIDNKLNQKDTEPHFMNLFRAGIAQYLNDFDSFRSLNDVWLNNKIQFEARIFEKHKPYLIDMQKKLYDQEIN